MEAQHTILLVLFGFSLLIGGTNGNCDQTYEVQKCMDILQPGMNLKALAGKQPSWNRTQLDHVCRHVDEFFLCYDNFVGRCSDDGLPKVKVVLTATLDYMCGKGREHTIKDFEVTKGNCDQISGIQKCMNILQQGIELKTITKNHESWYRTQLDHACRHLDEYFLCYDNFVERCGDDGLRKVKVVLTGTFDYICGKGRELYLKSRVCLNEEPTSSNIKKCVVKSHMNPTKGEVCDKINDLSKCLNRAADHCGEDGKKYIDGLFKELISGLIDCDGLSHGVIIAIVGAVTVTFSLVAFVITSLMKRRKRHVPFEKMESCEST